MYGIQIGCFSIFSFIYHIHTLHCSMAKKTLSLQIQSYVNESPDLFLTTEVNRQHTSKMAVEGPFQTMQPQARICKQQSNSAV